MQVPAVVAAGDLRAAKHIYGESKAYLPIAGRPLVAHVVAALQRVPEVSEVWVVGNADRLAEVFSRDDVRRELRKPLRIVPQQRNLYENAWAAYRLILAGGGPQGRDPGPEDLDRRVLYLSADLPFATPQEISQFVRRGLELDADYVLGLCTEESMADFYPEAPGEPGIRMAYFNVREGRFRQNNLHLVKPGRIRNRYYIEEMYEHRYQKQFGQIVGLAWRLLRTEAGGPSLLFYYALMHLAAVADRRGWRRLADRLRSWIPLEKVERAVSSLLGTRFCVAVTDMGGCAVDIDNEHDYDAARARFEEWRKRQNARAEQLYGPLPLPPPEREIVPEVVGRAAIAQLASGDPE